MSWRIVHISNESRLSLHTGSLRVTQAGDMYTIPLEDVGVLMLESQRVLITSALLDACVSHKVAVFVCDNKYLPSGVLLPYQQHSRQAATIAKQLAWTKPFCKRLWQLIVTQKIENQAKVFKTISGTESTDLKSYARGVQSGDATNREGAAARTYFQNILPHPLIRTEENRINAALNYGYAVLRGVIARSLASYGFLTSVGIHHRSELNNFNLADDLIEPFRPYVDAFAFRAISANGTLGREDRVALINLLTESVCVGEQTYTLLRAIDVTVQSLVTATTQNEYQAIALPAL